MDLLKNYNILISYNPSKANMVSDALSQKKKIIHNLPVWMFIDFHRLGSFKPYLIASRDFKWPRGGFPYNVKVRSTFVDQIKFNNFEDVLLTKSCGNLLHGETKGGIFYGEGIYRIR